jgi:hypothetical protein
MPTNLLIGTCDIPLSAVSTTVSATANSLYPVENLFCGNKTDLFRLNADSASPITITFDLGAGVTKSANFLYIGNAGLLKNSKVTAIRLVGSATNSIGAGTTVLNITNFNNQTLYGPESNEFIQSFSTSAAFRYWFIEYTMSGASKIPHAKLFFGNYFDIGLDPNAPATIARIKQGGAQRRPTYSFDFSWIGVSYVKAVQMYLNLYRKRRFTPIIIFTDTWHDILMGNRVLFCRITNMSIPPRVTNYCDVTATFEEMP